MVLVFLVYFKFSSHFRNCANTVYLAVVCTGRVCVALYQSYTDRVRVVFGTADALLHRKLNRGVSYIQYVPVPLSLG